MIMFCMPGKSSRIALTTLILIVLAMGGMMLFFALYPFEIITFSGTPQIEILNTDRRVPLGGIVQLKIPFEKYWSISEMVVKTLVVKGTDPETGQERDFGVDSITSFTNMPVGKHENDTIFQLTYGAGVAGKDRRVVITLNYSMVGGRSIIRTAESEPFEVYIPDELPAAFRMMHEAEAKKNRLR